MLCLAVLWSLFYFSGLVAYAAYEDCDPLGNGQIEKSDQILAFLVADKLRHVPGMAGVFVAAVAGAVLSSLSSQANAMVVMMWEDFLSGWWIFANVPAKSATNITRVLSVCMGLLSISMAFLVANLGTLFQTAYSISGALVSPMDGLFITAVAAPWVSAKGATAGFVAALCFNLWIVIGKFTYGAGQSPVLPTSTEGCPVLDVVFDGTLEGSRAPFVNSTDYSIYNGSSAAPGYSQLFNDSSDATYPRLYDVSYCYLGMMGITIVLVVSTVVSLCTGPVKPDKANESYVNKQSLRFYRWLCGYESSEAKRPIEKGDDLDAVSLKGFSYLENGTLESA
ncbi:sodium-coupled monocarboxylate transporter 1-like [Penaeus monodon]|uniref:sodium-coupled monocarboxylate transporter 1-like n=1 Tax=Penaeus monodon TaxID=6687 RepID=UPI0018A7307C|nr:sodium-coupled monocarboxylate transporter 1-like [Penaeus monodon]